MSDHASNLRDALRRASQQRRSFDNAASTLKVAVRPTVIKSRVKDGIGARGGPLLDDAKTAVDTYKLPLLGLLVGAIGYRFRRPIVRVAREMVHTAEPYVARAAGRSRWSYSAMIDELARIGRDWRPRR